MASAACVLSFILRTISPQLLEKATLRKRGGQKSRPQVSEKTTPTQRSYRCLLHSSAHPDLFRREMTSERAGLSTRGFKALTRNKDSSGTESAHLPLSPAERTWVTATSVTVLIPALRSMALRRAEPALLTGGKQAWHTKSV